MTYCNICKKKNISNTYANLLKCNNCMHVFANIDLDDNQIKHLYSEKYFFGDEYINYLEDKKLIEKNANLRFNVIKRYIENKHEKNLLEMGCAYGFFLNLIKHNFKKVSGFDVSKTAVEYAKKNFKLDVFNDDLKEKKIDNKVDITCAWDVIEHLKDPDIYLKKVNKITNLNGLIAITTGDVGSYNAKFSKKNWRLIHPPSHIHYFSKKSMTAILENNGFEIIYFKHCGYYRSLKFMLMSLTFVNKNLKWLGKVFDIFPILNIGLYLNLYDIMYVIAKKVNEPL